ncbi:MAG TPA: hypothetical protein VGH64_11590 [Puia sp.]|jgi:Skp family chaperone for outer membrane proteins
MGTVKKNPNDLQNKEAKTTRPGELENSQEKLTREIQNKKPKRVKGSDDEGAADEKPFDARSNNMHQKR